MTPQIDPVSQHAAEGRSNLFNCRLFHRFDFMRMTAIGPGIIAYMLRKTATRPKASDLAQALTAFTATAWRLAMETTA